MSRPGDAVEFLASEAPLERLLECDRASGPESSYELAPPNSRSVQLPAATAALAAIAHELRTPLQALAIVSESLVEDELPFGRRRQDRLIRTLRHDVVWLQSMIENLLCSASVETGRFRLIRRWISLHEVIADAEPVLAPLLERRGQPPLRVSRRLMPLVWGDARRLGQAVVNLVSNASKYSDEGGSIELRLDIMQSMVRLSVLDRGPGIGEGPAARLFDPFYRVPAREEQDCPGSGLGLAVTRAIVEAHGGRVGARNRRGGGACFWIALPPCSKDHAHESIHS